MRIFAYALSAAIAAIAMLGNVPQARAESTVPFAQYVKKDCGPHGGCSVSFSQVAVGKRLEIEHVSCEDISTGTVSTVMLFNLDVFDASPAITSAYAMVPNFVGPIFNSTYWVIDHPVFAPVTAGLQAVVVVHLDKAPTTHSLRCTISGHRVTL